MATNFEIDNQIPENGDLAMELLELRRAVKTFIALHFGVPTAPWKKSLCGRL
jgi:hypothetical protein